MSKQVLAYHLAEALFTYIYSSGQPIFKRVNLLAFIEKCAVAMLTPSGRAKAEESVEQLGKDIMYLRDCYEPALDEDSTVFEKRSVYENYMDQVLFQLLDLISNHNLVDQKTIGEVYASKWSKNKMEKIQ